MPEIILDDPDGTLAMLRASVETFAETHDGAAALRRRRAAGADLNRDVWAAMAEAGWLGLLLPEELGGAGLSAAEQAVLSEALGRALITEPLAQLSVFAGALLSGAAPSEERTRLADGLMSGGLIVSPVWQDRRGGLAALMAGIDDDAVILSGRADLVVAGGLASDYLVLAVAAGESVLLSLPACAPGITLEQRPTVDGAQLASVSFADCAVPAACILARGAAADRALASAIEASRLALAAELAGIASRALEITVEFTKGRVQFGKPIASFQAIQHRLTDMWAEAEFACAAIVNALERAEDQPGAPATLAVLAAKARAGDAAVGITRRAIHLHGAMGFTDECDIGFYMKRAVALNATLGRSEDLRLEFLARERAA